jgi:hypothetical protein
MPQQQREGALQAVRRGRVTTMAHSLSAARASAAANRDVRIIEADEIEKRLAALELVVSIRPAQFASSESLLPHS